MPSTKLYIKKKASRKDGTTPIYLRYQYNPDINILLPTGQYIKPTDWHEEKGEVRKSNPNAGIINLEINKKRGELNKIYAEAQFNNIDPTCDYIKELYNNPKKTSSNKEQFWNEFNHWIDINKDIVTKGTMDGYKSLQLHLQRFE